MDLMHYYSMSSYTVNILHRLEIKANVDWFKWAFRRRHGWIMFPNIHFMLVFISAILSSMENQHENETWNVLSYWLVGSIIPGPISYHGDCTVYYGKSCPSHGEGITKGNQFNNLETIITVLQTSAGRRHPRPGPRRPGRPVPSRPVTGRLSCFINIYRVLV